MSEQMKGITVCGDCAYYSMKKHKCTRGCTDEGDACARFYVDCPLPDVRPVVYCEKCRYYHKETGKCLNMNGLAQRVHLTDFCSYGSTKEATE